MTTAIRCTDLWKSYRVYHHRSNSLKEWALKRRNAYEEFWPLQGIDIEVPTGGTLGIVGPNGAGKSTLLKVLSRILTPDRGTVEVNGRVSSLLELGTGFHPELTGRENVHLAGTLLGESTASIRGRYDRIVEFAGLEDFMELPVKNYSSGMYARLAFAVAITVEPDILLIDEVLAVGDEQFQTRCHERMAEFRKSGRTIVFVSHSLDAVRTLCQDAVWLEDGKIQATGRSSEVVAKYLEHVHGGMTRGDIGSETGQRWGSGEMEILDVQILGPDRNENILRTDTSFEIKVTVSGTGAVDDVSCGIAIYRSDDLAHMFGQNTREAGIEVPSSGRSEITFRVPNLPLLKGNYVLTTALHDSTVTKIYDWHERRYSFMVFNNPQLPTESGGVHLNGSWEVKPC